VSNGILQFWFTKSAKVVRRHTHVPPGKMCENPIVPLFQVYFFGSEMETPFLCVRYTLCAAGPSLGAKKGFLMILLKIISL
jgi:hypothetical protein